MKSFIRCLILLAVPAFAGTASGHGFDLFLNLANGGYVITPSSEGDQVDSFGTAGNLSVTANNKSYAEADYLFYSTLNGTPTTTLGQTVYAIPHGFVNHDGSWPPAILAGSPTVGWTATFNVITPLYFSDGTAGAVAATAGTQIQMYDADFGGAIYSGTSPGYVNINGATPFYSGFQISLQDPHEIEKELILAPGSTQTYGEYGFAYDVTVTFNTGQAITTGPFVDVYAMSDQTFGDFADNAYYLQQDAATNAIYSAATAAGAAVLGTASTWSGAANNTWANANNWVSSVPGATSGTTSNDTVVFYSGNTVPVVDAGRNVQTILFESANVGALTLGTTGGNALLLTAGGSIQVTSWVVNPQTINAPLVLEGANALYTFNSDSTTASATLSFGGSITGGAAGNTVLTLGGDNIGANTISGAIGNGLATSLAIVESGPCNWILSGPNTYTGGTTVNQGTLTVTSTGTLGAPTSPLTINTAANGISATVYINGSQSVGTLSSTILGGNTTGTLNIAAGSTLRVNQAASADFGATLNIAAGTPTSFGTFALQGPSTLEIDAAPALGANSAINVNGGTLRFNLSSGAANIGSGVTVTVASTATLQLAGSVSALSGGGVANIVNNGSTASGGGLSVTGTNQSVGTVTGAASNTGATTYGGDTVVGNGTSAASLTAAQILQNSLTINAGSTVTIGPSGSSSGLIGAGTASSAPLLATDGSSNDSFIDTSSDPFLAIQAAIASGAIGSLAGQRLENRIAAIERLRASDPGLDESMSEDAVISLLDWSAIASPNLPPSEANSSLLNPDSAAVDFSNSSSIASGQSSELFASSPDQSNNPAAVPEPSAFLLAAFCGLAVAFAAREVVSSVASAS